MLDTLSTRLLTLRLDAIDPIQVALGDGCAISLPHGRRTLFHVVLEGEATLDIPEAGGPRHLKAGDCALLLRGSAHRIAVGDGARDSTEFFGYFRTYHEAEEPPRYDFGTGAPRAVILSSAFGLDQSFDGGSRALLPALMQLAHHESPIPVNPEALASILTGRGARAAVAALVAQLYFATVRRNYVEIERQEVNGTEAQKTKQIGLVRRFIDADPGSAWTVARLAAMAGMSRSCFADLFTRTVGVSPIRYLTDVRLERAGKLLESGTAVSDVAFQLGYKSPAAFSRMFRRAQGRSPRERALDSG